MALGSNLALIQDFLGHAGDGMPGENIEVWEILGDNGVILWADRRSGRAAAVAFIDGLREMMGRLDLELVELLAGENHAALLGHLAFKLKPTDRVLDVYFAIFLAANADINRFRMIEDSFALSAA